MLLIYCFLRIQCNNECVAGGHDERASAMNGMASVRITLVELREAAKLSQAELAKRLDCAPSRVSRLESGELQLGHEDALAITRKIGESYPKAKLFAEYLEWK